MKAVLVTGGAGYIGSHTCKALNRAGYYPIAYDNLIYGHEKFVQWGPFEYGDIRDAVRLRDVLQKYLPSAVVHFAAFAYVGESVENPSKYYWNNVVGSLTLLEVMKDCGIRNVVFSSTCATYGVPQTSPIRESHPQLPMSPYGHSKLAVERMLLDFDIAYSLKSIILRYFNAAGADPENEIGEDHTPETHLIPLVLDAAAGRRPHITVFGDDYDTRDGTCIRDFIHVSDLADAHVLALKLLEKGDNSEVFNLSNGNGFSVKDIIEVAKRVTGRNILVRIGPRRHGDPAILLGDSTKAMKEMGWMPKYGDVEVILRHAWAWHKKMVNSNRGA